MQIEWADDVKFGKTDPKHYKRKNNGLIKSDVK